MAVESEKRFFLPNLFAVDEDKKGNNNPNYYKPQISSQVLPRISFTNIPTPKLISSNNNPNYYNNYIKIEKVSPSPSRMEEESAIKVVRSVVAGFLLKRWNEVTPFTPIQTKIILDHLKDDHLLSPFEKQALLEVGEEDEDEDETLISALNSALLSIEADTEAVNCLLIVLDGKDKERVVAMSIQPEKLVNELLPVSLHLEHLSLSPEELFPNLEQQQEREMARLRALCEN